MAMMHLLKASRLGCSSTSLRLMNATVGTQVRASTTSILQATDVAAAQPYLGKPLGQASRKSSSDSQERPGEWFADYGHDAFRQHLDVVTDDSIKLLRASQLEPFPSHRSKPSSEDSIPSIYWPWCRAA
mmetsp:Transcript_54457/g.95579  ORF Transcript_54457/g.95579 Transcript_54457/m.95579 type:complete len:129 (-) Transcript_54457:199-585(-)